MKQSTEIKLNTLVTREEYSEAVSYEKRRIRKNIAPIFTGIGAVLTILGIVGLFFGSYISLSPAAAACPVLVGLFLVCYDGLFAPMMDKATAAREYEEKEDLHFATSFIFGPDSVAVQNGRIKGEIPFTLLTGWSESPALFTLTVGRELNMAIPKRQLTGELSDQLRLLLETAASGVKIA